MSKIFEYLSVSDSDLGETSCKKIDDGWTIEFVTPERLTLFCSLSASYSVIAYKMLLSKEEKKNV